MFKYTPPIFVHIHSAFSGAARKGSLIASVRTLFWVRQTKKDEKAEALDLVNKIAALSREIARLQKESKPLREELEVIEAEYTTEVVKEKDGIKLKYPDREARAAAVKVKLSKDTKARDLKEKLDKYDDQIEELETERERLEERKDILTFGVSIEEE